MCNVTYAVVRSLTFVLLLAGCATLPEQPEERALYNDLHTIVASRERIDWSIDRLEVESLAGAGMRSACETLPARRRALRTWLDGRIAAEGGPAREAWARNGNDLDGVETTLTLERVRQVLDYAEAHAAADCPFWLRARAGFDGVHAAAGRFVLFVESMGSLQVLLGSDANAGGHGVARIIPARGLSDRLTLGLGAELGVASTFPRDEAGRRSVRADIVAAVPVLLRVVDHTWRYDTDVAPVFRAPEEDLSATRVGARLTQGVAIAALRIAGLQPYAGIFLGYAWLPGDGHNHVFRVGTRVGVEWDP